jgi:hypothetical protein
MALAAGGHSSRDFLKYGTPMQVGGGRGGERGYVHVTRGSLTCRQALWYHAGTGVAPVP